MLLDCDEPLGLIEVITKSAGLSHPLIYLLVAVLSHDVMRPQVYPLVVHDPPMSAADRRMARDSSSVVGQLYTRVGLSLCAHAAVRHT